ncbi:MAG: hypothetical protein D6702_13105 [Planctomycetota bacterium]|nr:MAG: hypothetical protein D6702_13105 [Planctomycetota bacterium]
MFAALVLFCPAPLPPQDDPLAVPVLEQEGRTWTAREVLEARAAAWDATLLEAVERDPEYRRIYLRSTAFLTEVQAFSDHLILDQAGIPQVGPEERLAEAAAWAADRGMKSAPAGALAAHGFEIDNRARLIALQPPEFSTQELRKHMLSSVPEFFHELALSWIRLPLFDAEEQRALDQDERRARYETLAEAAEALEAGELSWEEAVDRYAVVPADRERNGYVGLVRRTMVGRYEEPLLRQTFADLGYKMPEGMILRGPIMGEKWVYLVRIETVRVHPVVDLNLVRDRVERSLREKMLQEKLEELRSGVERRLLAPVR